MIEILIIACAVIAALLITMITATLISRRDQKRALSRLRQQNEQQARAILLLNQSLANVTDQQERLRDTLDEKMDALKASNEHRLDQMRETVSEKLDGRLTESFRTVNKQLAEVHRGLGQMHELAGEFADLKKILGGVKTRGIWGEMQLRALLEEILAPNQYIENAAIPENSPNRVEFAVRLPASDGEALLPIDSKFPQEDFIRLMDAVESGDPKQTELCGARLERALTEQAKLISEKYKLKNKL